MVKAKNKPARQGILILGMHRSGTSSITRAINLLGAEIGDRLLPESEFNRPGFWEHQDVVDLNEKALSWLERAWHDPRPLEEGWQESPFGRQLAEDAADLLVTSFGEVPLWAIKDPRLSLLAPPWIQATRASGAEPRCVICIRHPAEVVGSLGRRDHITESHACLLWLNHFFCAVDATKDEQRCLVDYDLFMVSPMPVLSAAMRQLGLHVPAESAKAWRAVEESLDPAERHHKAPLQDGADHGPLMLLALRVYQAARGIASGGGDWTVLDPLRVEAVKAIRDWSPTVHELLRQTYMQVDRANRADQLVMNGLTSLDMQQLRSGSTIVEEIRQVATTLSERLSGLPAEYSVTVGEQALGSLQDIAERLEHAIRETVHDGVKKAVTAPMAAEQDAALSQAKIMSLQTANDSLQARLDELGRLRNELIETVHAVRDEIKDAVASRLATEQEALRQARMESLQAAHESLEARLRETSDARDAITALARQSEKARAASEQGLRELSEVRASLQAELNREMAGRSVAERDLQRVRAEYSALRKEEARRIEDLSRELEKAIANAQAMRSESERLAADLAELQKLNGTVIARAQTLEAERDLILGSRSWRYTAPIRRLKSFGKDLQMSFSVRQPFFHAVRRVYEDFPISLSTKLRVKAWLFTNFPTVFRGTNAYRRWRAFGVPYAEPETFPLVTAARVEAAANSVGAVYEAMLATSRGRVVAGEHVGLNVTAPPRKLAARAIAFYLPQFHPIAENDEWWGRGFTEWTNVSKAVPQYRGHHQPRIPGELGFYDLRLPEVLKRQTELARLYGVSGFCFHYYWFSGRRLLERPLDQFIASPDIDFPFCLCWANESWTRRWDGAEQDVLLGQVYNDDNDEAFIRDLLPYLRDRRYIRIDGRPLLIVYRPSLLPDCKRTLEHWRDVCRQEGLGEIFLAMVQFDVDDPVTFGFDAAVEFPPHKLASGMPSINGELEIVNPSYEGYVVDYRDLVDRARNWPKPEYPMFRGVFPSWDNEARKPGRGYTFENSTPASYRNWLQHAVRYAQRNPVAGESMVFINAWNEWGEGAYLEPDRKYGYAYLQATRDALDVGEQPMRVVVISHDAHPHGAQYLALNLVRELKTLGAAVEVVLLGSGRLQADFAKLCRVHELFDTSTQEADHLVRELRAQGLDLVIANTAVSGRVVESFHRSGVRIVSLVHELPGVIKDYGLESAVRALATCSTRLVVASESVATGLRKFVDGESLKKVLAVRPQGLFTRSRYRGALDTSAARLALRRKMGLPDDSRVVVAVGYADRRKGVDLLAKIAGLCGPRIPELHFVWVGHRDATVQDEVAAELARNGMASRFHFVGLDFETDDYYAGADVYALSSREDPFPSVVLESLSVGTPVVAFEGTGGGADLVAAQGGMTVPAFDLAAYAKAIERLMTDEPVRRSLGEAGRELIDHRFSFRSYVMDLMAMGGSTMPRVSVIVPNFNYAHYLRERLQSITAQRMPVYEIIVLDDGSRDNSLEVLQELRASLHPEPRIVVSKVNSGSVFRQWLRGLELARGDLVWIAEADDLATPDFLERVVAPISSDPGIVMSYCQSEQIDEAGRTLAQDYLYYTDDISVDRWRRAYVASGDEEVDAALAIKNTVPNVSAAVFRRDALLETLRDNIDEISSYRIAGDWVAYLRLLRKGKISFDPHSGNRHRRHGNSVTLGSAAAPHYEEVVRAQGVARELFKLSKVADARSTHYASALRSHFGLDETRTAKG